MLQSILFVQLTCCAKQQFNNAVLTIHCNVNIFFTLCYQNEGSYTTHSLIKKRAKIGKFVAGVHSWCLPESDDTFSGLND